MADNEDDLVDYDEEEVRVLLLALARKKGGQGKRPYWRVEPRKIIDSALLLSSITLFRSPSIARGAMRLFVSLLDRLALRLLISCFCMCFCIHACCSFRFLSCACFFFIFLGSGGEWWCGECRLGS